MGTMSLLPGVCYSTHNNVNQRYLNPGGKCHKITFFWNTFFWVTSVTKIDIQLKTFMFYNFHAFSGYFFFLTQNVMQKFHCVNVLRTHINYWWQKSENLYFDTIGIYGSPGSKFPTICRQDLFLFKAHFWTCIWKDLLRQLYDLMRLNFNWDSEINHRAQKMLKKVAFSINLHFWIL